MKGEDDERRGKRKRPFRPFLEMTKSEGEGNVQHRKVTYRETKKVGFPSLRKDLEWSPLAKQKPGEKIGEWKVKRSRRNRFRLGQADGTPFQRQQ